MDELPDYEIQRTVGEPGEAGARKQLLRIGPRNVRIIKEKLRGIALALGIPSGELPPE